MTVYDEIGPEKLDTSSKSESGYDLITNAYEKSVCVQECKKARLLL